MLDTVPNNTDGMLSNGNNLAQSAQWNDASLPLPANTSAALPNTDWQASTRNGEALLLNPTVTTPQTLPQIKATPRGPENGTLINDIKDSPVELDNDNLLGVVKLNSAHSSSQTRKAAEQSWETSITENSYLPAPIKEPWGEEMNSTNGYNQTGTDTTDIPRTRAHTRRGERVGAKRESQLTLKQDRPHPNPFPRSQRQTPKQFEGSWDDMLRQEETLSPVGTMSRAPSDQRAASSASSFAASAFTKKVVSTPEPHPERRPICAPIALNKSDQRIDFRLPKTSSEDQELYNSRVRDRKLCNEHHLRSNCNDPRCEYDHESIIDGVYLALRVKARRIPCSIGTGCRRHDCYASHHCPNVSHSSSCGRQNCPYAARGMHAVTDLEIARMIEPDSSKTTITETGQTDRLQQLFLDFPG